MTRNGKIARLPREVRDELNGRLFDGEPGNWLVNWLNEKPEVQKTMKEEFGGRAITEQNLSEWKQGGYEDWRRHRESIELTDRIFEEADDYVLVDDSTRADQLADMAAALLGRLLHGTLRMADGPEKHQATLEIIRELARLRRAERERERALREEAARDAKKDGGVTTALERLNRLFSAQSEGKRGAGEAAATRARDQDVESRG